MCGNPCLEAAANYESIKNPHWQTAMVSVGGKKWVSRSNFTATSSAWAGNKADILEGVESLKQYQWLYLTLLKERRWILRRGVKKTERQRCVVRLCGEMEEDENIEGEWGNPVWTSLRPSNPPSARTATHTKTCTEKDECQTPEQPASRLAVGASMCVCAWRYGHFLLSQSIRKNWSMTSINYSYWCTQAGIALTLNCYSGNHKEAKVKNI